MTKEETTTEINVNIVFLIVILLLFYHIYYFFVKNYASKYTLSKENLISESKIEYYESILDYYGQENGYHIPKYNESLDYLIKNYDKFVYFIDINNKTYSFLYNKKLSQEILK
jgi:hypothetical protein